MSRGWELEFQQRIDAGGDQLGWRGRGAPRKVIPDQPTPSTSRSSGRISKP